MLTEFEKLEDLDGIHRICNFMERLYKRTEDQGIPLDEDGSGDVGGHWSSIEQASRDLESHLFSNIDQADPFKVLEKVLQHDADGASPFTKQKQPHGNTFNTYNHPLADFVGSSHSKSQHTTPDGTVAQAEQTTDAYFIQGDIAASLACALVLTKVNLVAEYAVAQRNLSSARQLIEGIGSTLSEKRYKTSVIENKSAMLSYLTEACTLLGPCKRLFPRASEVLQGLVYDAMARVLQGLVYDAMARVHKAWFDNDTASKWTVAAEARGDAAKSESDDASAVMYARE
ncbi:hypothetical protein BG003_004835 [Podila horticola]|nr:hypothetical protein BG003_004835 [Podila horticola]